MTEQIVEKMRSLRLSNMARAYSERHGRGEFRQMSADEAICLLVDDEWSARQNKKLATVILKANFKPEGACLENLRYQPDRGFARSDITPFRSHEWIRTGANVLLFGPTGAGKSYLAEAICLEACRLGHTVQKLSFKRMLEEIRRARATGAYLKLAEKLCKVGVLLMDDFAMATLNENELADLAEILEERSQRKPTVVTSQYPIETWLERLPEPTMAEAICDRLRHNAYVLNLKGVSMRSPKPLQEPGQPN
jgi:DNA replication protein DnaC